MINIDSIRSARKILGIEIQTNMKLQGTKEYSLLCESAGALNVLLQKLEKYEKRKEKKRNGSNEDNQKNPDRVLH